MPVSAPEIIPLFQAFPPVTKLPIYAWRAFTSSTLSVTSSVAKPRPLSDIPSTIVAMVYYHDAVAPSDKNNMIRTIDYGDVRPYNFLLPDGTTRRNTISASVAAYQTLRNALLVSADSYPA